MDHPLAALQILHLQNAQLFFGAEQRRENGQIVHALQRAFNGRLQ